MRVDNIEITMKIPIRFDKPDRNGVVYTKEAIEDAIINAEYAPITIINNEGIETPIGVANDIGLFVDDERSYMNVSGILNFGGTCEQVEMDGNVVKSFRIASVGITE